MVEKQGTDKATRAAELGLQMPMRVVALCALQSPRLLRAVAQHITARHWGQCPSMKTLVVASGWATCGAAEQRLGNGEAATKWAPGQHSV